MMFMQHGYLVGEEAAVSSVAPPFRDIIVTRVL